MFANIFFSVSKLPWWAGIALAIACYFGLHGVATMDLPVATKPGETGAFALRAFIKSIAYYLQFILPIVLVVAAVASILARRKRSALLTEAAQRGTVTSMSWQEFEMLVGEAFRLRGYTVTETGGGGADGGIDLVLTKGSEKSLVQCKQWRAQKVGVAIVRELYGAMAAEGAAGGFVVTAGEYTRDATDFARGRNIELIDGNKLVEMIQQAQSADHPGSKITATRSKDRAEPRIVTQATTELTCPNCGKSMVKRIARQGKNAGKEFWGCPAYPLCRGTREILH